MIVFSDTTPRGDTGEERSWSCRRLPDANIYSSVLIERTVVALSLHRVTFCAINIVHVYMSSTTVDKWTLGTETTITMLLDMEVRASKKKIQSDICLVCHCFITHIDSQGWLFSCHGSYMQFLCKHARSKKPGGTSTYNMYTSMVF